MNRTGYYLGIAYAVSAKSSCLKKRYGAVIVKNDEIIATGYNGPPQGEPYCTVCTKASGNGDMEEYLACPAVHAEMNAIISAARRDMVGADLYLTGIPSLDPKPCKICERLIKNSGIQRVITQNGIIFDRNGVKNEN